MPLASGLSVVAFCGIVPLLGAAEPAAHEPVRTGLWKTFEYDNPTMAPIVFSGWSRANDADAVDYCVWLDVYYDNGKAAYERKAVFRQGTHDWEKASNVFLPAYPVKTIKVHAIFRSYRGVAARGSVDFRDFSLVRPSGESGAFELARFTDRPFSNGDDLTCDVLEGDKVRRERKVVPRKDAMTSPIPSGKVAVWTEDSMRLVTPLTFPDANARVSAEMSLAKRERESVQILLSSAADVDWKGVSLVMPMLRRVDGTAFAGTVTWQRQGYLAREFGANPHPFSFPANEKWFPDPLMPAAPMRVRPASTQGAWVTVYADAAAEAGVYSGDVIATHEGREFARVPLTVKVEPFSLPATFGLETAYAVMDGFTKFVYPEDFKAKRRETWDIMLDHRLNPDDISRTSPPDIEELLYARSRGMNRFNILNIVPPPKNPDAKCVLICNPEDIDNKEFEDYFFGVLTPYVESLRAHGLDRLAYVYGFDERNQEFYPVIDAYWKRMRRETPGIPLMVTAHNFRDYVNGGTNIPCVTAGDWFCPLTKAYDLPAAEAFRRQGKKVWWYTCCNPKYPYANFASWECPPIEGRLLGWMTYRWRADGFLFWIVNKWHSAERLPESDTYFPEFRTFNPIGMPGDGIMMYPGERSVFSSIRLAQCRDAEEDYEYLKLAAAKVGQAKVDAVVDSIVRSLTDFSHDAEKLRTARRMIAKIISE